MTDEKNGKMEKMGKEIDFSIKNILLFFYFSLDVKLAA